MSSPDNPGYPEDIELLARLIEAADDSYPDIEACWRCGDPECWGTCDG